jgi:hypothetical protein
VSKRHYINVHLEIVHIIGYSILVIIAQTATCVLCSKVVPKEKRDISILYLTGGGGLSLLSLYSYSPTNFRRNYDYVVCNSDPSLRTKREREMKLSTFLLPTLLRISGPGIAVQTEGGYKKGPCFILIFPIGLLSQIDFEKFENSNASQS